MDVTSLLNLKATQHQNLQNHHIEISSTLSDGSDTTAPLTTLSTPLPEQTSPSRRTSDHCVTWRRMPWDAGGYSLTLTLDGTKLPMYSPNPMLQRDSSFERSTSGSSYDLPSEASRSRASSMSSTCFDMAASNNATPITSTHPGRQVDSFNPSFANSLDSANLISWDVLRKWGRVSEPATGVDDGVWSRHSITAESNRGYKSNSN